VSDPLSLKQALDHAGPSSGVLVVVDESLTRSTQIDSRRNRVVEMRQYAARDLEGIANPPRVSRNTVTRDWPWPGGGGIGN